MKRILTLLLVSCSFIAVAQYPVSNISITLPAQPMPNTGDWAMPFVIAAQARLIQGQVPGILVESRILVTIKKGGSKICGSYTQNNAPFSAFNSPTKTWSGGVAISLLGSNCELQPGNYELCVQFFSANAPSQPLSSETCKAFTIQESRSGSTPYAPPQNIMPFEGKVFNPHEASLPILFRWTPVLPKPKADVIYKIRVVEILPGQSRAQAIQNNPALEEKEVRGETQTSFKLSPRCHDCGMGFIVEAMSSERVQGRDPRNYGKSEPTTFSFAGKGNDTKFNPPQNTMPAEGKIFSAREGSMPIVLRWTPVTPKPKEDVLYKVRVIEIKPGQTKASALTSNKPVEVLEVRNNTQTTLKLAQRYNGLVWDVEASSAGARQGGLNYGRSEATTFTISNSGVARVPAQCDSKIDSIVSTCNGYTPEGMPKYKIKVYVKNRQTIGNTYLGDGINTDANGNKSPTSTNGNYLTVYPVPGYTISNILPATGAAPTPIAHNGQVVVSFDLVQLSANNIIKVEVKTRLFHTENGSTSGSICPPADTLTLKTCRCGFCDALNNDHFGQAGFEYNADNNSLQVNQMLSLPSQYKVKQLKAEIVTFDWQTDNPDCKKCQQDDKQFGVIGGGQLNAGSHTVDGVYPDGVPNSHELNFNCMPANGMVLNNGAFVSLGINLPLQTTLSCCQDKFTFCIRFTIVTTDCKSCSIVKCYTQVPSRQHKAVVSHAGGLGGN